MIESTTYVKSLQTNDVNVLRKRRNQAKSVSIGAATLGTAAAGISLLPKNKIKIPCLVVAVASLLGALNSHNYVKQADEKINQLSTNA